MIAIVCLGKCSAFFGRSKIAVNFMESIDQIMHFSSQCSDLTVFSYCEHYHMRHRELDAAPLIFFLAATNKIEKVRVE